MCNKISESSQKLRPSIRLLEVNQELKISYDPGKINLSTIRVTASSVGIDLGRKYKVSKQDDVVTIQRIS